MQKADWEMSDDELVDAIANDETLKMAQFLATVPDKDPLADIENMRRNLNRALGCTKDGNVWLSESEIKHWIAGIDEFVNHQNASRDS